MTFPAGVDYTEIDLVASQGRVRRVWLGEGRIGFQDPDQVIQRTYADGRIVVYRNPLILREDAARRLTYNFDTGRVVDSLGQSVGARQLRLPSAGRVTDYKNWQAKWVPLETDPRTYRPAPNEEIVERVIFVDRSGNLRTLNTSYGRGRKYDKSRFGRRWVDEAKRALGIPDEQKATTDELQKAVLHREFIIKRLDPIVWVY